MGLQDKVEYYKARVELLKDKNSKLKEQNYRLRENESRLRAEVSSLLMQLDNYSKAYSNELESSLEQYKYLPQRTAKCSIVISEVSKAFGISSGELRERSKRREVTMPRQMAQYIINKKLKGYSLKETAKVTGGFDHATVIHACKTVENTLEWDTEYKSKYTTALERSLERIKQLEDAEEGS